MVVESLARRGCQDGGVVTDETSTMKKAHINALRFSWSCLHIETEAEFLTRQAGQCEHVEMEVVSLMCQDGGKFAVKASAWRQRQ